MKAEFRLRVEAQLIAACRKLDAALDEVALEAAGKSEKSRVYKRQIELEMYGEIIELLFQYWDTKVVLTMREIADRCPAVKFGRKATSNPDKFTRIVRKAISENMRPFFGFPILSRPRFRQEEYEVPPNEKAEAAATEALRKKTIGYWIARSQAEVDEYLCRTEHEVCAAALTRFNNKLLERRNFGLTDNPFEEEIRVITEHLQRLGQNDQLCKVEDEDDEDDEFGNERRVVKPESAEGPGREPGSLESASLSAPTTPSNCPKPVNRFTAR